jgi:type I restriction enzyme, S subunit
LVEQRRAAGGCTKFSASLCCVIRQWREIERWIEDDGSGHTGVFPERCLSDFIRRRVIPIDRNVHQLEVLNVIAKITFGGELHLRNAKEKQGYKGPLFNASPGCLVISKIRVAQGSLCVVPDQFDHLAVSPEYPVYEVDHALIRSEFLRLVIRTSAFQKRIGRHRSGNTTKTRIRPAQFEALHLPVPTLEEQDTLIAAYTNALTRATQLEQEAETVERAGWQAFESALGITAPPPLPDRPVFVARYQEVERWSHEGVLRAQTNTLNPFSNTSMVPLGQMAKVSYGIQKCPANRPGVHARPYLRVANVQRGVLDLREVKYINVPDEEMPRLRLEVGDVLLCEGNSADLVGRGAIWSGQIQDCVHQNHVLRVRVDRERLLPEFVMAVINSSHGQSYFRSKAKRTTNLASINSKEVAGLPVPRRSLDQQHSLLSELNQQTQAAAIKFDEAKALRQSAWNAFESALFTDAQADTN